MARLFTVPVMFAGSTSGVITFGASPIAGGGNLILPSVAGADTLVALAAAQTLTNKTLTTPTVNGAALSGTLSGSPNFSGLPTIGGSNIITAATAVDLNSSQSLTNKVINGLTLTAATTGFTIAGGTTSKTLQINNSVIVAGTDGSTLNISTGGTLTALAFTAPATGIATFLATPSSANLRAALTDESGTGALIFAGGELGAAVINGYKPLTRQNAYLEFFNPSFETGDSTGWSQANGTPTIETTSPAHGLYWWKSQPGTAMYLLSGNDNFIQVSGGSLYEMALDVQTNDLTATCYIGIEQRDATNAVIANTYFIASNSSGSALGLVANTWKRLRGTVTLNALTTTVTIRCQLNSNAVAAAFYGIDNIEFTRAFISAAPVVASNILSGATVSGTNTGDGIRYGSGTGVTANTASSTTAQNLLSYPFAAGDLNVVGRSIHVFGAGYVTTNNASSTVTIAVSLGGTVIASFVTPTLATGLANLPWYLDLDFNTSSLGTSGTLEISGYFSFKNTGGTTGTTSSGTPTTQLMWSSGNSGKALNLTTALTLQVTVTFSINGATANVCVMRQLTVYQTS